MPGCRSISAVVMCLGAGRMGGVVMVRRAARIPRMIMI